MRNGSFKVGALAIAALCSVPVAAGCGDDLPSNAVATVGDTVITKSAFDRTMYFAAASNRTRAEDDVVVPDPPTYRKCVAALKKQPLPQGQKKQSDAQLKQQCTLNYKNMKSDVMQYLIQTEWLLQEGAAQGIEVSEGELRRRLESAKKDSFKTEEQFKRYLRSSAQSEADILVRLKTGILRERIMARATKSSSKISDQEIKEYYEKNKERFTSPEFRDLRVVVTKSQARADQARQALEDGQSFTSVVKQYSVDPLSTPSGGRLPNVSRKTAFDDSVFAASKGRLEGPVRARSGWYVFRVEDIEPGTVQSLDAAKDTIRGTLQSQQRETALAKFVSNYRKEHRAATDCAEAYRTSDCSNGPEPPTETAPVGQGTVGQPPSQPGGPAGG